MITHPFLSRGFKFAAALLLGAAGLLAFEGQIDMQMTTKKSNEPTTIHYFVKGKLIRTEMLMDEHKKKTPPKKKQLEAVKEPESEKPEVMISIIDLEKMEMTTLMASQKMYMVNKLPAQVAKEAEKAQAENPFKPTGRKEIIAGVQAEEYAGQTGKTWTELWLTKELGRLVMSGGGKNGGKGNAWDAFLSAENSFTLRTVMRSKQGGDETMRMETLKVDRTSLSDSLFVPPEDYTKMEMPSLGGMLRGLAP